MRSPLPIPLTLPISLPLPLPDDTPSGLLGGCDLCAIHTEALGLGRLDALPTVSMRWHSPLSVAVPHPTLATANPLGLHFDGRAPPRAAHRWRALGLA